MYIAALILLIIISGYFIVKGFQREKKILIIIGIVVAVATASFFGLMSFWGDMLWYKSLGFESRFWTEWYAKIGISILAGVASAILMYLFTLLYPKGKPVIYGRYLVILFALVAGLVWGFNNWSTVLKFFNRQPTGIEAPVFDNDISFYLFTLPFLNSIVNFLLVVMITAVIATAFLYYWLKKEEHEHEEFYPGKEIRKVMKQLFYNSALLLIIIAAGKYIDRYSLMISSRGVVSGAGWTDVHVRIPIITVFVVILILLSFILVVPSLRRLTKKIMQKIGGRSWSWSWKDTGVLGFIGVLAAFFWFILLQVVPGLFQWLKVEPNEISLEKPYISRNIEFTRRAFQLDKVLERDFDYKPVLTGNMVEENETVFSNIRLWDWRALDAVYQQFQEIRLYYEFLDVDIDRYRFNDDLREVMISAREMETENLPQQSQTFINKRFKYTHGFGITVANVNDFTPSGLPRLLVRDIPPKSEYPELKVTSPRIYYGEGTDGYVVVNSEEREFDYPKGEANVYNRYDGTGGVQISNLWRKVLYGWKLEGTRFLLSSYPTKESRVMFNRQITRRVQEIAPFLKFDNDPYIVLVDGALYWYIDGYTVASTYPYSESFSAIERIEYKEKNIDRTLVTQIAPQLNGYNYVRNSVKAIVNAYNGEVTFYVFEKDDPVIQVWRKIFPGLFKDKEEMPVPFMEHVRYPMDRLLVQGKIYSKYHMTDPEVFYNQEDLWIRATEKYYNDVQPVPPYYIIWERPGSNEPEFVLIQPFTPKNRQVLIGWIAGMSDMENYGQLITFKFPKEMRVLGPQQVETKIDQDSYLSERLTLWDQRGSNVIRGNVLAIPVGRTIMYVEPIYLKSETAAYPELRLVVIMHNDELSYAPTFEQALEGLLKDEKPVVEKKEDDKQEEKAPGKDYAERANKAFNDYIRYMGNKDFEAAARSLRELESILQDMGTE